MKKVRGIMEDADELRRRIVFQRFLHERLKKKIGFHEKGRNLSHIQNAQFATEVLGTTFKERQERAQ